MKFVTSIKDNPGVRNGRCAGAGSEIHITGSQSHANIVAIAFAISYPVINDGISALSEVEQFRCIHSSSTVGAICISCTAVIGDVHSLRATVVCSATPTPGICKSAVSESPIVACLKVLFVRMVLINSQGLASGTENLLSPLAYIATTTVGADVSIICSLSS